MASSYRSKLVDIARRFLTTAVVVDDESFFAYEKPHGELTAPGRANTPSSESTASSNGEFVRHSLDAQAIASSFASMGLICGILSPTEPVDVRHFGDALRRADIVVLDWQLHGDTGEAALSIVKHILQEDQRDRLRQIAIYTGAPDIGDIGTTVLAALNAFGYAFSRTAGASHDVDLTSGHCRISIYAKSATPLPPELEDRIVSENGLPDRLVTDFAYMTKGLLPSIALTALTAVRESTHRVLDKFHADLDSAYLTHRACLDAPDDSEVHVIEHLASELYGIMDDAIAVTRPSGFEAIEGRLDASAPRQVTDSQREQRIRRSDLLDLARDGLERVANSPVRKNRAHESLSAEFAREMDATPDTHVDHRFAWMMCFRTVFDTREKILRMGTTVMTVFKESDPRYFLCMRPLCDSIRIISNESFLLLPLVSPSVQTFQLVIPTPDESEPFRRVSVDSRMSQWALVQFSPNRERRAVVADHNSGHWWFTDVDGGKFRWIGELKTELSQSVAHDLASGLSRIALNRSEWLRRSERIE